MFLQIWVETFYFFLEEWRHHLLFRTVYGPEIIAIYQYIEQSTHPVSQQELYRSFLSLHPTSPTFSTQSIDDVLAFLTGSYLIKEEMRHYQILAHTQYPPRLLLLQQLMRITKYDLQPKHPLDPLYLLILDEVFIKPNRTFVDKLHREVNSLPAVKEQGGLSQEKIQAWKRVMTFLGIGKRVATGFFCNYNPELLREILAYWKPQKGPLQDFFEKYCSHFLPFETASHDAAHAISETMLYLANNKEINLISKLDSPSRAYFDENRFQYVTCTGRNI